MRRVKILVMADWFDPAFKAGGPIRSVVNFARQMAASHDVFVFTGDRDLGDDRAMPGLTTGQWCEYAKGVKVFYAGPGQLGMSAIRRMIGQLDPDYIYCNSMFSTAFTIYPLLLKRLGVIRGQMVLSPRGMLKPSALAFKAGKKKIFLKAMSWLGIPGLVHFHATDDTEEACIREHFGQVKVTRAPNFPGTVSEDENVLSKQAGSIKLVFVGRLHPVKNLHFLLELLKGVKGQLQLSVIGLLEDAGYFKQCQALAAELPANCQVSFEGEMPHEEVTKAIARHHAFVLPTQGENFGHAIYEALAMGRPVVISDQTPWRGLAARAAGWDLPLDQPGAFCAAINELVQMDQGAYDQLVAGARDYIRSYLAGSDIMKAYLKIFPLHES